MKKSENYILKSVKKNGEEIFIQGILAYNIGLRSAIVLGYLVKAYNKRKNKNKPYIMDPHKLVPNVLVRFGHVTACLDELQEKCLISLTNTAKGTQVEFNEKVLKKYPKEK